MTRNVHAPPIQPLTPAAIAQIFDVGIQDARRWCRDGRFGASTGTAPGRPGAPQMYDPVRVLDYGLRSGRLDPYWNRLGLDGRMVDPSAPPKRPHGRRPAPDNPTTDLDGRRYLFIPHAAERLGVTRRTVVEWRVRSATTGFPEPDAVIDGNPAWFEATLVRWGREATPPRLDDEGRPIDNRPVGASA